ncbi:hypothetical protein C8Q70DRAFT_1022171 [Cubamyces menziesii]|nr:hypothetical protein C8Q70DRAFT_1022171 [Cubamyces menziesii]
MTQRRGVGPKRPCTQPVRSSASRYSVMAVLRSQRTAPVNVNGCSGLTAAESEYSLQAATRGSDSSPWNLRTTHWRPRIAGRRFQASAMSRASTSGSRVLSLTASLAVRSRLKDLPAENPVKNLLFSDIKTEGLPNRCRYRWRRTTSVITQS